MKSPTVSINCAESSTTRMWQSWIIWSSDEKDDKPIFLKDVGYMQTGYDLRRSTVDLDGAGEVVGGVVIMEQNQNVLAITRALDQRLATIRASLPKGIEIVTTYNRSSWIWTTLKEFFATLLTELIVLILVTALFLGNPRIALGPIAILILSTLFTALPLAISGQTINLFSLAGLCIAIGEIADATIVHVENCAAELSIRKNLSVEQRREIVIHSITHLAKPLTFSLLIILASFLPVFFLEDREARLFDPLAYSKTFAMAFSTIFTLFLLPIVTVWIFERQEAPKPLRYGRAITVAGIVLLLAGAWRFRDTVREFLPEIIELGVFLIPVVLLWIVRKRAGTTHNYQDSTTGPCVSCGAGLHDSSSICVYGSRPADPDSWSNTAEQLPKRLSSGNRRRLHPLYAVHAAGLADA